MHFCASFSRKLGKSEGGIKAIVGQLPIFLHEKLITVETIALGELERAAVPAVPDILVKVKDGFESKTDFGQLVTCSHI